MGRGLISPYFCQFCQYTPFMPHVVSTISVFFQGSACSDFIENIYTLDLIPKFAQFSGFSSKIVNYIFFFIFLFKFLSIDDHHFAFSSKIFPRGRCDCHLVFNLRQRFGAISFVFFCPQHMIVVWSPIAPRRLLSQATAGPSCHQGLTLTTK